MLDRELLFITARQLGQRVGNGTDHHCRSGDCHGPQDADRRMAGMWNKSSGAKGATGLSLGNHADFRHGFVGQIGDAHQLARL
ncbi:hypothetical protein D3C75_1222810 [compost metagenome]